MKDTTRQIPTKRYIVKFWSPDNNWVDITETDDYEQRISKHQSFVSKWNKDNNTPFNSRAQGMGNPNNVKWAIYSLEV